MNYERKKETKQIVHITTVHPATDTRILFRECTTLASNGFNVALVAPHNAQTKINGVSVLPLEQTTQRLRRIIFLPWVALIKAWAGRAEIYHLHDPELIPMGLLLRVGGKTVVYDMHENLPQAIAHKTWIALPLRHALATLSRFVLRVTLNRFTAVILAETQYQKDFPYLQKPILLRNFPELAAFPKDTSTKRQRFTFVYLGSVTRARGSLIMIQSIAEMQQEGLDIGLLIVGAAPDNHEKDISEHCAAQKIGHFTRLPYLPFPQALQQAATCHVGFALMQAEPNMMHSYPTKVFEYLALGLPVILSDFPFYRQLSKETGGCINVDGSSVSSVKTAAKRIFHDTELHQKLSRNGQEAVTTRFNWKNEQAALIELYRELQGNTV